MIIRRRFLTATLFALSCLAAPLFATAQAAAQATEITRETDARNRIAIAGRQRMLSQQLARNTCFVMAGLENERYVAKTDATIRQFETALAGLKDGDRNLGLMPERDAGIVERLHALGALWATLGAAARQIAAGDVHPVPMQQLIRLNLETLTLMETTMADIEARYRDDRLSEDQIRTINLAGRQQMLSQKASKEACFHLLDINGAGASGNIAATIGQFDISLSRLLEGDPSAGILPPDDRRIRKQLQRTHKAWSAFKKLLQAVEENPEQDSGVRVQLANLSDQVLLEMDLAVVMYAE